MASENSDKMTSELHTTRRILLRVAYDGTNYHGWQVQPNAKTIEGELNRVLTQLTGEKIQVTGASRTDAGVHALGNVAVFDTASKIPAEKFSYALNQRLPEDIVIQSSLQVADDFHPRHCDCCKTYEYDILNRTFPLPAYRNTAYFLYGDLDLDAMRRACQAFPGEHDFASFCAAGAQVQTTVRTIYSLEVLEQPLAVTGRGVSSQRSPERLLTIRVRGNGFLYNMVRIIAGTLVEVGRGHIRSEEVEGIIAACDRAKAGPTAPARGLRLVEIKYD
ncbi:tRNA pseudouridine(38-40) synthase TruA [Jutongia sp.]|uniref:tRNA pseudouridine(38-40) synthase TruA n=1 Tax=Jutongia sp. TaxID=2944204 RepID=UPI000336F5A3|nr:tRNA pseudouridine synthase A 3 [Clostridium sp. CAG:277]